MIFLNIVPLIMEFTPWFVTRFEKTNEMLLNFNALSATRYENAAVDYRRHTALLLDMKRELDSVFRWDPPPPSHFSMSLPTGTFRVTLYNVKITITNW
jgi:hypothetical protein